jgi:predicted Fe-S protein YdhL (DUF1289 family)
VQPKGSDDSVVKSPCIDVCKMEAGLCAGCLRTIDEVARWSRIGDDEKRLILLAVAQRRSQFHPGVGRQDR